MKEQPRFRDFYLEPADNKRLARLGGQFDENLRQVERRLGVEINNRGHRFRVSGEPDNIDAAVRVLHELYDATEREELTPERVHLYLQAASVAEHRSVNGEDKQEVVIRTRRGEIRGRGPNQRRYLKAIREHDLNFGIGPAGTGKTYLAVASAVEALETERAKRIVLVRPAVEAGERLGFLPGDLAQKGLG